MNSIYDYNCVKHMRRRYVMKRRVCKNIIITGVIITMILCGGCGRRREEQPVSVKHEEEDRIIKGMILKIYGLHLPSRARM